MTDFLLNSIMPLTVLLLTVWLLRKVFSQYIGVTLSYYTWSIVPLGLVAYHLPLNWVAELTTSPVSVDVYQILASNAYDESLLLSNVLLALWAFGVTGFITYVVISHIQFYRQLSLSAYMKQGHKLPIRAYKSDAVYSPCLVGIIQPKLILPVEFETQYNQEQQQLIIAHELCHYRRKDMWWNLLACALVACFWFHPLVWWSYRYFRQDQEYSCDFAVLARTQQSSRINYSKALVITAESTPPHTFALLSFNEYGERNMMMNRIQLIKADKKTSLRAALTAGVTMLALLTGASYAGNSMPGEGGAKAMKAKHGELAPVVRIEPRYPEAAVKDKVEGSVLLKFDVDAKGYTQNISVIKAEPADIFNKEARRALKKWQYKATGKQHRDNLVQLDFLLSEKSQAKHLLEQIVVKK